MNDVVKSNPNSPASKPNAGDKQAAKQRSSKKVAASSAPAPPKAEKAAADPTAAFEVGKEAPSDLFAVMNADGIEDAFSTKPPERGHQLAFKGRVVDKAVTDEIANVKRVAARA